MTYANPQTAGQTAGTNNPGMSSSESMNQAPSAGFVAGGVGGGQAIQQDHSPKWLRGGI